MNRLLPLLVVALLLTACQSTENGQALQPKSTSPVIFSLDGESFTTDDFAATLKERIGPGIASYLAQGTSRADIEKMAAEANVRSQIFDMMIQEALLLRYARQHGLGIVPEQVDASVLMGAEPTAKGAFTSTTDKRVTSARDQLRVAVIVHNTRTAMAHIRRIVVADDAAAQQVLTDLAAGTDFATLAKQRSHDQNSAQKGGDLGWIARGSYPELDATAFSAALNTPTKVISDSSASVIEVLERQDDRAFDTLDQLTANPNYEQYINKSFTPWYEQLRRDAEASRELQIAGNFDPNSVPLPFPEGTP